MATRVPALTQLSDPRVAAQLVFYYQHDIDRVESPEYSDRFWGHIIMMAISHAGYTFKK